MDEAGVRQGCIISPYLFSVYTDGIMIVKADDRKEVSEEPKVDGRLMGDLWYGDDSVLLSKTEAGPEKLINRGKEHKKSRRSRPPRKLL